MNVALLNLEIAVVLTGMALLLLDLWTTPDQKRKLGYAAAGAVGTILLYSCFIRVPELKVEVGTNRIELEILQYAFGNTYVFDSLALFFKRFFLLAEVIVLVMSVEFGDRFATGISEYYALILFALAGKMFASSANDFTVLFVSIELIAVTFYVL